MYRYEVQKYCHTVKSVKAYAVKNVYFSWNIVQHLQKMQTDGHYPRKFH
jgi:hypothetical protein